MRLAPSLGRVHPRIAALATGGVAAAAAVVISMSATVSGGAQQGAERGATVFMNNCQVCHGQSAEGFIGPPLYIPPEIAALPRPAVVQELTGLVRGGIPGAMPGFLPAQISDADVAALTDYLLDVTPTRIPPQEQSFYAALAPVSPPDNDKGGTVWYVDATQHTVRGPFLDYWRANGGLEIFGYPLTEEYIGIGEDGQRYTMQMFERARFEHHPNSSQIVQLGRLGGLIEQKRMHFLLRREAGGPGGPSGGPPGGP